MEVTVNGKHFELECSATIAEWLEEQGEAQALGKIIIEHNKQIVAEEDWAKVILEDGDVLEIFKFVGGGR